MFTTLDHLEHHINHNKKTSFWRSFGKEIKGFLIFFTIVFIINSVVVNAQLYQSALLTMVAQLTGSTPANNLSETNSFSLGNTSDALMDQDFIEKKMKLDHITQSVSMMNTVKSKDFIGDEVTNTSLQENLNSYSLDFNLLPPTNRVIIPKINVNTPLLLSSFNKNIDSITKEDFDKDLYHGVVQYPTTPYAGQGGNTLIFGHTSYESWKHNPYATIFSNLPKLSNGDIMQVVQDGKLYEYEVVGRSIVAPDKVNQEYLKYTKGNYLTLLGCYPIGSDKQRILIIGKLKQI